MKRVFLPLLALLPALGFSQTPGGVDNASSNLQLWYRAQDAENSSSTPASNGEAVQFWRDQSGGNNDATQETADDRPSFNTTNPINGNPVLTFDGANDHLAIENINYSNNATLDALTSFIVFRTSTANSANLFTYDANEYFRVRMRASTNSDFRFSTQHGATQNNLNSGPALNDGQLHIATFDFDGVTTGDKRIFIDGELDNSNTPGTGFLGDAGGTTTRYGFISANSEATTFNGAHTANTDESFEGDIAEIIYFDRILTATEIKQVETYLAIKYGQTLVANSDGDGNTFEAGEGDYISAAGGVIWDADANQTYHNNIVAIAVDAAASGINQTSSKSVNSGSVLTIADAGMSNGDYIVMGHDGLDLSVVTLSGLARTHKINRTWKMTITGGTNIIDQMDFEVENGGSNYQLIIDDNASFTSPVYESVNAINGSTLTFNNVDFSSFAGDIYVSVAMDFISPIGTDAVPVLWYAANQGVETSVGVNATDGQTVEYWRDQSGADNHAIQATENEKPTYDATNTINGNPVLTFDGEEDYMPISQINYANNTTLDEMTIYAVTKTTNAEEGIIVSFDRSSFYRFSTVNNGNVRLATTLNGNLLDTDTNIGEVNDGNTHVIGADFDGITTGDQRIFFDGELGVTENQGTGFLGNTGELPRYGFISANSEATTFDGDNSVGATGYEGSLAEIIYFQSKLSDQDRQKVESYLAIKYGTTLSNDTDGDNTAFEAGEGDYMDSNANIVWDADANQTYHNDITIIGVDNGYGLSQTTSKSENANSEITLTDAGLADGEFVAFGHNSVSLALTTTSPNTALDRQMGRAWKAQFTGATKNIDQIQIDLSASSFLPNALGNFILIASDNEDFSGAAQVGSASPVGSILTYNNVDFSALSDNVYITIAFNIPSPGGVIDGLTLWYRADVGAIDESGNVADNNEPVQTWIDNAYLGNNGYQTDISERPVYSSSTAINNNPTMQFDGSETHFPIQNLEYNLTDKTLSDLTIYTIVESTMANEGMIMSFDRSSFFRFGLNESGDANYGFGTSVEGDTDDFDAATYTNTQPNMIGADYSAGTNIKNLFFNGGVETRNNAHNPAAATLGQSGDIPKFGFIGSNSEAESFNDTNTPTPVDGSIAEIVYFESVLTATERSQVETYLALKYGITLSSNYVASDGSTVIWDATANATYNTAIAGIGIDTNSGLSQTASQSESVGSVLAINDAGISNSEYIIWGSDNGDLSTIAGPFGPAESRINRIWKFQITGATTQVDGLSIDLSSIPNFPTYLSNYTLLVDDENTFTGATQVSPISLNNGILSFSNVSLSNNALITLAFSEDLDSDTITDANDLDDDNDGIPDVDEGNGVTDTDGDGIVDSRDLDSDNDGIGDLYESGAEASVAFATLDTNGDGVIDAAVGTNGLADGLETAENGIITYTISNSDGDAVADFRDLDSDNNGISDLVESGQTISIDSDDDGVFEGTDTDQDGIPDEIDAEDNTYGSTNMAPQDQNSDGEFDFRDLDNDGNGTNDIIQVGLTDGDMDGRLDDTTDGDGDGVMSVRDDDDATFGNINIADLFTGTGTDWYSYTSGDWTDPDNWTTDPSGSFRVNPTSSYPSSANENVSILNGDELTLNFNSLIVSSMYVENGGILNVGETIGHNFNTITGEGIIKLTGDNFPSGDMSIFNSDAGGTIEFIDRATPVDYNLTVDRSINNMNINLTSNKVVFMADYTLAGDLTVRSGTMQINDDVADSFTDNTTPLRMVVNGDVLVDATGNIAVGDVDASTEVFGSGGIFTFHELELLGNLTNNGSMIFTNLSNTSISDGRYRDRYPTAADNDNLVAPVIPSAEFGVVEVLFTNGSADQLITLNGPSDFYRIEVAKGTSQTFTAEFNASSTDNFRLLGRIAMHQSDDSDDTPNIANHRALGLEAGIMKLGNNIRVIQIAKQDDNGSTPSTQGGNRNYMIDLDAQLWLAGTSYLEKNNGWGIHPFGKLKVSDNAELTFTAGSPEILVDNQGVFEMTGGTVSINQFRNKTGADGAPRGSFIMTGGTINIGAGGSDNNHALFSIPWADQNFIFNASDDANPPVINLFLAANAKDNAAVQIGVKEGNYDIGVSEFNIFHTRNADYKFASTVPFYNFSYDNNTTNELIFTDIIDADDDAYNAGGVLPDDNSSNIPTPASQPYPLVVLNDFTVVDGRINLNGQDLTVGNLLTIDDGAEYNTGTNTTHLNGSSAIQRVRLNGTAPLTSGGFYNLQLSMTNTEKEFQGALATVAVQGDLTIDSDVTLNDNGKIIQVNGNISNSGLHITDVAAPGKIELTGGAADHEIGGDGTGRFSILDINDATNVISMTADMQIDSVLNIVNGPLSSGTHTLTIASTITDPIRDDANGTGNFGLTRMIQTAGNDSDGGLSILCDADETILYPIGTNANGVTRYTPVSMTIAAAADDGYVAINPIDSELSTLDQTIAGRALTYHWKSTNTGFTGTPSVSYVYNFDASDVPGGDTPAAEYIPGWVVGTTRVQDPVNNTAGAGMTASTITTSTHNLETARYTAGIPDKFTGTIRVVYAIRNGEWHDPGTWSDAPDGTAFTLVGELPQTGDIVQIGDDDENFAVAICDGVGDDCSGINYAAVDVAQVSILRRGGGESSILTIDETAGAHSLGIITNREPGAAAESNESSKVTISGATLPIGDFGEFVSAPNTIFAYSLVFPGVVTGARRIEKNGGGNVTQQLVPSFTAGNTLTEYPTLQFESSGGTGTSSITLPDVDITVNNNVRFYNSAGYQNILRANPAGSHMTIMGELRFSATNSIVEFPVATGPSTITIMSDINFQNRVNTGIIVEDAVGAGAHKIQLAGNIVTPEASTVMTLYRDPTRPMVDLEFIGEVNSTVDAFTVVPELHKIIMNKGTDATYSADIQSDININAVTNTVDKSIDLQNGTLILNNAGIDIDLNSGGFDFNIPASAALQVTAGTARVSATGTGSGNGIRLDGKLTIDGGNVILDGGSTADNYIEYGTGGSSEIEISSGNLVVGSQLRRNSLSDDGVIQYNQSGGTAIFGANTAPEDGRGVFEIIKSGSATSSFNLSGASTTFALVHAQDDPLIGSFIIDEDVEVNISTDPYIDFGFNADVAGTTYSNDLNETYEINSFEPLPNIRINNANHNSPIVEIVNQALTASNNLEILNSSSLVSNNFDLTILNQFRNDGTYTPGTNTTIFDGATQSIIGTTNTTFNNLTSSASNTLSLSNAITVNGNLSIDEGTLDDSGNQISLLGNLSVTTTHTGAGGISFDGSNPQEIDLPDGQATVSYLRTNNASGVLLNNNNDGATQITISEQLAIDNGNFQIGDNRLILFDNTTITTTSGAFDRDHMIVVPGVLKEQGVEKMFNSSTNYAAFLLPVGTPDKYTPVVFNVDDSDDSGSILIKPINAVHPSATGPDALNYYWVVTTNPSSITGFEGSISFTYEEGDANNAGQNESTWENNAARLRAPNWFKPSNNLVNITTNTMTFTNTDLSSFGGTTFDGEYTVGNDIPDLLAQYRTVATGMWNSTANWEIDRDGDGVFDEAADDAPLSEIPQPGSIVIIDTGDEITMDDATDENQNVFSVSINGTLDIADTDGHNFGEVDGNGLIRISNQTLPAGDYTDFFTLTTGSLELAGNTDYTISGNVFNSMRGLTVSGTGTKTLPALSVNVGVGGINVLDGAGFVVDNETTDVTVDGEITITNGDFDVVNIGATVTATNFTLTTGSYNSTGNPMDLSGNLSINGGTFNAGSGTINIEGNMTLGGGANYNNDNGTVIFDGTTDQNISGDYSTSTFSNMTINKAAGNLVLGTNTDVYVDNLLTLTMGNINTTESTANFRLTNPLVNRSSGHIDGPLQVALSDGESFNFPIGKSSTLSQVSIDIANGSQSANPLIWEVEYYAGSPASFSSASNTNINLSNIETNGNADEQVTLMSDNRYWRIEPISGSGTLSDITFDISNIGTTSDDINDQLIQVMHWDEAGQEFDHLGGSSSGSPTSSNTVAQSNIAISGQKILGIGFEENAALPVELIDFYADVFDESVAIHWVTAAETNNSHFVVERSEDGINYEYIGDVDGHGTTNQDRTYSLVDYNPIYGRSYYRLIQYDYDGKYEIFAPIAVNREAKEKMEVKVYPSRPEHGKDIKIEVSSHDTNSQVAIQMTNMQGQVVNTEVLNISESGKASSKISADWNLPMGLYQLTIKQAQFTEYRKVIIR